MPMLSPRAVEILRTVQKRITEEPRRLYMEDWGLKVSPEFDNNPPCGTVACIAGHVMLLTPEGRQYLKDMHDLDVTEKGVMLGEETVRRGFGSEAGDFAKNLLGLTSEQVATLFFADRWPQPFHEMWLEAHGHEAEVKVANARIEYLIQTGQ
jgi:hypothetical protein